MSFGENAKNKNDVKGQVCFVPLVEVKKALIWDIVEVIGINEASKKENPIKINY